MSRSFSKGLGVSAKLQLPNLIYLILLVVVLFMYFQSSAAIENLGEKSAKFNRMARYVSGGTRYIQGYLEGGMALRELMEKVSPKEVKKHADALKETSFSEQFNHIWEQISQFEDIRIRNTEIDREITRLTRSSAEKSDQFLEETAKRLVSEKEREKVGKLERLCINGSHINTVSSLNVMIRFLRLKEDFSSKPI